MGIVSLHRECSGVKPFVYNEYTICFNPKPIPDRDHDFDWYPNDYDGPEDPRGGTAGTVTQAMIAIDEEVHADD